MLWSVELQAKYNEKKNANSCQGTAIEIDYDFQLREADWSFVADLLKSVWNMALAALIRKEI